MKILLDHRRWAYILGLAMSAATTAVLALGLVHGSLGQIPPAMIALAAVSAGLLVALFFVKRLYAWFICLGLGLIIGLSSAASLILGPPLESEFDVAFLTVAVFAALGFLIGAMVELIRQIHRALHAIGKKETAE